MRWLLHSYTSVWHPSGKYLSEERMCRIDSHCLSGTQWGLGMGNGMWNNSLTNDEQESVMWCLLRFFSGRRAALTCLSIFFNFFIYLLICFYFIFSRHEHLAHSNALPALPGTSTNTSTLNTTQILWALSTMWRMLTISSMPVLNLQKVPERFLTNSWDTSLFSLNWTTAPY